MSLQILYLPTKMIFHWKTKTNSNNNNKNRNYGRNHKPKRERERDRDKQQSRIGGAPCVALRGRPAPQPPVLPSQWPFSETVTRSLSSCRQPSRPRSSWHLALERPSSNFWEHVESEPADSRTLSHSLWPYVPLPFKLIYFKKENFKKKTKTRLPTRMLQEKKKK